MSRLLMLSGASKMVFDPRRCKKSSTSRSTVRRGGLSTKKHETSDYPVKSHNSPTTAVRPVVNDSKEPLGTMALHCRNNSQSHWGQWLYTGRNKSQGHWGQWIYTGRDDRSGIDPRIRLGRLGLLLLGLFLLPPRLLGLIALELLFELLELLVLFLPPQFNRLGRPFYRFVELS